MNVERDAKGRMLIRAAEGVVGGLSSPGKMPGKCYSIPARRCRVGSKLRNVDGSVCSGCYATTGRYAIDTTQAALERRLKTVQRALRSKRFRSLWVEAMETLMEGQEWFRWHDSGDLLSARHLELICEVCDRTPGTRHWIPTKQLGDVLTVLQDRGVPANLTVRISAYMVGEAPQWVPDPLVTSTVHEDRGRTAAAGDCPAIRAHSSCDEAGGCRKCWDSTIENISYGWHGMRKPTEAASQAGVKAWARETRHMAAIAV